MKSILLVIVAFSLLSSSCGDKSSSGVQNPEQVQNMAKDEVKKEGPKVKVIETEESLINKVIILADPYEFSERLGDQGILVDVRTAEEYSAGHISGAINIDFLSEDFTTKIDALDKINPINIYCQSGGRSGNAAIQMKKLGFKKIYDLEGGYSKWKELGL